MIRRGTWLVLGAALGIAGYRRVSRMLQSVAPPAAAVPLSGQQPSESEAVSGTNGHTGQLAGGRLAARQPGPSVVWQASARGIARAVILLVREIRVGMADYRQARDEYMNRHTGAEAIGS
jgi:hypothetical protein